MSIFFFFVVVVVFLFWVGFLTLTKEIPLLSKLKSHHISLTPVCLEPQVLPFSEDRVECKYCHLQDVQSELCFLPFFGL